MRFPVGRIVLLLAVACYMAALVWAATQMPDQVGAHFGASGDVDRYDSKTSFLVAMAGVGLLIFGLAPLIAWASARTGGQMINMPSARAKAYWTSPEHSAEFVRVMGGALDLFFGATGLLLTGAVLATVEANRHTPPVLGPQLPLLLAAYLGFTVLWIVWFVRRFRAPAQA